jgi:predicted dehydrogenase
MSANKFKVGIIGCGGIASAHASRLSEMPDVQLTCFCDVIKERAEGFANKYGGRAYVDFHDMLTKEPLDSVYVCLPPFAHSDEVEIAAERGVHVFIEKPIALDMKTAGRMAEAARKHGIKTQVGYLSRFGAAVERAKELIDSGKAGDIGLVLGRYFCNFIGGDWWRDKSRSGGQLVEQSTHLYDVVRYLCGDVERVYTEMGLMFWKGAPGMTSEDTSATVLRFKSGAMGAIVATTWAYSGDRWAMDWAIVSRNYTVEFESANSATFYSTRKPSVVEKVSAHDKDLMVFETRDFLDAIKHDRETRTPISEGAKTLELTLAAVRSAESKAPVHLPLRE